MSLPNKRPKVAIVHGFAEGFYHSRIVRKALRSRGYRVVFRLRQADIILAHSAGCYLIPENCKALIVHVGYTYWPSRGLWSSLGKLLVQERKLYGTARWLLRCTIFDLHMLNVWQSVRMAVLWPKREQILRTMSQSAQLFICNREDSYSQSSSIIKISPQKYTYISLPGGHNDLWEQPEFYIDTIEAVYGS